LNISANNQLSKTPSRSPRHSPREALKNSN